MSKESSSELIAPGGVIRAGLGKNTIVKSDLSMGEDPDFNYITNQELISLIAVLSNGYIKPDVRTSSSLDGVRDTKRYFPIIEACFKELLARLGLEKSEILGIISSTRNRNYEDQ